MDVIVLCRYKSIDLSLFARTSLSAFLTEAVESLTTKYLTFAFSKRRTLCVEKKKKEEKNLPSSTTIFPQMEKVLQYTYTTAEKSTDKIVEDSGIFGSMMEAVNRYRRWNP